jgi:hypothetical protein
MHPERLPANSIVLIVIAVALIGICVDRRGRSAFSVTGSVPSPQRGTASLRGNSECCVIEK